MMKWLLFVGFVLAVPASFFIGRWSATSSVEKPESKTAAPTLWICPMHPQIRRKEAGTCPICTMDLAQVAPGDDTGPRQLAITPASVKLAGITTKPVQRRFVTLPVRMVGKVDFDETRVRTIAARVPGRLERLFVDYTGIRVARDDHLVDLYSPKLLTAQAELIAAEKLVRDTAAETSEFLAGSNQRGYQAAREKLLLWGLKAEQVDEIVRRGTPEDHMLIRSPAAGVVIKKNFNQGDYVVEGSAIYRIADLSHLWIQLDAYEQDLPWLRYGQGVSVTAQAIPGEIFEGWISFIDPIVDDKRRTVRVRVDIQNADGRLKPGMFVKAVVQARLGAGGKVLEPRLAGKWISPMHPEIVKDGPGQCDICGMDLVPAESLGYTSTGSAVKPLVVPSSAVLVTGTRGVVYVELEGKKKPTFEGREVILGPRAGDFYIVVAGLREHELVVVNGAFRIDSAMQIMAKPSMMSMRGDSNSFTGPDTAPFRASLESVYRAYLDMQVALAGDDVGAARSAANRLRVSVPDVQTEMLSREARARWEEEAPVLAWESQAAEEAATIAEVRDRFQPLSRSVLSLERTFRHAGDSKRVEIFCPMAFDDKGASWLQVAGRTANPYFGSSMLVCGMPREELLGVPGEKVEGNEPAAMTGTQQELEALRAQLQPVYDAYFDLRRALAADDAAAAAKAAGAISKWKPETEAEAFELLLAAVTEPWPESLGDQRQRFHSLSDAVLHLQAVAGHKGTEPLYRMHCPMAFEGAGADWLQRDATLANPYYGSKMLDCGSVEAELSPAGKGQ